MKALPSLLIFASFIVLVCAAVLDPSSVRAVYNVDTPSVQREAIQHRALDQSSRFSYHFSSFLPRRSDKLVTRTKLPTEPNSLLDLHDQAEHAKRASFEGKRLKGDATDTVYLVLENKLRGIASQAVYEALFGSPQTTFEVVPQPLVDAYPKGPALDQRTSLIQGFSATVYLVDGRQKRGFTSLEAFNRYGFSAAKIVKVGSVVDLIPDGPVIT